MRRCRPWGLIHWGGRFRWHDLVGSLRSNRISLYVDQKAGNAKFASPPLQVISKEIALSRWSQTFFIKESVELKRDGSSSTCVAASIKASKDILNESTCNQKLLMRITVSPQQLIKRHQTDFISREPWTSARISSDFVFQKLTVGMARRTKFENWSLL